MPCKFFASGSCTRGSACKFLHDNKNLAPVDRSKTLCKFYLQGQCRNANCEFAHSRKPAPARAASSTRVQSSVSAVNAKSKDSSSLAAPKMFHAAPAKEQARGAAVVRSVGNQQRRQWWSANSAHVCSATGPVADEEDSEEEPAYFYGAGVAFSRQDRRKGGQMGESDPAQSALSYRKIIERETAGGPPSGNRRTTRPLCKFYAAGFCRFGEDCKLSHGDGSPSDIDVDEDDKVARIEAPTSVQSAEESA